MAAKENSRKAGTKIHKDFFHRVNSLKRQIWNFDFMIFIAPTGLLTNMTHISNTLTLSRKVPWENLPWIEKLKISSQPKHNEIAPNYSLKALREYFFIKHFMIESTIYFSDNDAQQFSLLKKHIGW